MSDATAAPAIPTPSTSPLVAFSDGAAPDAGAPQAALRDTAGADWALAAIESGLAGDAIDTMRAESGPDGAPTASSALVALSDEGDFFVDAGADQHDFAVRALADAADAGDGWHAAGDGESGIPIAAGAAQDFPRHGFGFDWTDADPLGIG